MASSRDREPQRVMRPRKDVEGGEGAYRDSTGFPPSMRRLALTFGASGSEVSRTPQCEGVFLLGALVGLVALFLVPSVAAAGVHPSSAGTAPLIVTINSSTQQLKLGTSGMYSANATGGNPPYSYLWYSKAPNGTFSRFGTTSGVLFRPLADGIYTLNVSAKDAGGNQSGTSTIVSVNGFSPVSIRLTSATSGGSLVLTVLASGGTPPYRFRWTGAGLDPNLSRNPSVTLPHLANGEYTVGVQVTDAAGYSNSTSVKVEVNEGSPSSFPYLYLAVGVTVGVAVSLPVLWVRMRKEKDRPGKADDTQP